jgi:ABC-2 type transport system ATP-binding protein
MVRVEHLTKRFGDIYAIEDLTFEVLEGEILGFLGPNGAGKTTTMRILTCFFPPTEGRATVAGYDVVKEADEVRRFIGYMPEHVPLYRDMTVEDALDFIAHAKGFHRQERAKYVSEAIEETGLCEVRKRRIAHLSKGYRQRVGLAQALIGNPKVLILDEPTVGLDPRQIAEVRALIKGMAGRRTVVLSTHILPEVQMTCSRVVILNRGKIAASGTPEKLTTQMRGGGQSVARIVGPPIDVLRTLEQLRGIRSVRMRRDGKFLSSADVPQEGEIVLEYVIETHNFAPETNAMVAEAVVQRGWRLLELYTVGMTLEEIFLRVVAGEASDRELAEEPMLVPGAGETA